MKTPIRFVNYSGLSMASYRYRTLMPAQLLDSLGYDVKICRADQKTVPGIYIFSKHFNPKEEYVFAKKLKDPNFTAANVTSVIAGEGNNKSIIIFDICDSHFNADNIGSYYKEMVKLADIVVCSTEKMKEVVQKHCSDSEQGRNPWVILDSYEFPERTPRFNWEQSDITSILWYGHPTNIKHLQRVWNDLGGSNLMIITKEGVQLEVDGKPFPIVPYSIDSLLWGFAQCDITIIPNAGSNSAKGANRMIESIRQGVFVVAEPMPAYEEFRDWMYIGEIKEGIEWCRQNKAELQGRIQKAQEYIIKEYNPTKTGERWQRLILMADKLRNTPSPQEEKKEQPSGKEPATMALNQELYNDLHQLQKQGQD